MRLVVVSDTHGLHNRIESLPAGDILVHAGDFMNSGYDTEDILSFDRWLGEQSFKHRVVCAGNHDRHFQNSPQQARSLLTNALYLENAGVTIGNVSFWGSPYTPEFLNWAFMYPRGSAAKRYWDQIPYNLDVLITHGPPFGILDQTGRRASRMRGTTQSGGREEAQTTFIRPYPRRSRNFRERSRPLRECCIPQRAVQAVGARGQSTHH
jgi:3',5'-cyclic AMP phosphodiesterase CpdA